MRKSSKQSRSSTTGISTSSGIASLRTFKVSQSGHFRPIRPVPPTVRCPQSSESNLVLVLRDTTRRTPSGNAPEALFNDGSRACNQFGGYLNPQLLGRLEIDNKFKPPCLRGRYVARIGYS